jgi:hypothetical protein
MRLIERVLKTRKSMASLNHSDKSPHSLSNSEKNVNARDRRGLSDKNHVGAEKIDYFHLFYVEAIMQDSAFPLIHKIKPIFENLTLDEFIELVEKIFATNDYEMTTQFLYFLLLFRDMPHLQDYINSDKFSIANLEKLIIFVYGFCTLHDHSTDRIIDEILYFLTNDRLLDLILHSDHISHDKLLLFFILTKFDTKHLNKYFGSIRNISEFSNYFLKLPDDILKTLISRNYQLFQYIMLMISESDHEQKISTEFFNKYRKEIEQFSKLHDMIRQYKQKPNYIRDRELPFGMRDMGRISFLVNMIKILPEPEKAISYFNSESVFMDDFEKSIVYAIVTDPILKHVFQYYDTMLKTG